MEKKWVVSSLEKPRNFIDSLNLCDEIFFPNIYNILYASATLTVTTCTPERSFSTLRRLKDYLRNTMNENRLNGLAQMNIHREIKIDIEQVINKFADKNRKIPL